jgi:hypothetical protein
MGHPWALHNNPLPKTNSGRGKPTNSHYSYPTNSVVRFAKFSAVNPLNAIT